MSIPRDTPTIIRRPRRARFHEVAEDVKAATLLIAAFTWLFTSVAALVLIIRVTWSLW